MSLFEEKNLSDSNIKSFWKTLASGWKTLFLGFIIIIGASFFVYKSWFFLFGPKHGERIEAPSGLEQVVREHFRKELKNRSIIDLDFYYCEKFSYNKKESSEPSFSVIVKMNSIPSITFDNVNGVKYETDVEKQFKVYAVEKEATNENENIKNGWLIIPFNDSLEPNPNPCIR